ncbi:MAG: T9SS type A sorting domain-containing protein [Bacteroidia bacterium]
MKKYALLFFASFAMNVLSAQTLEFRDPNNNNQLLNGQTIYYSVSSAANIDFEHHYELISTTNQQIIVKARRVNLQLNDPNTLVWYCMRIRCYGPNTPLSANDTIFGNAPLDFSTHYVPTQYSSGISRIQYSAFLVSNPNDSAVFYVEYDTPSGILSNLSSNSISLANPTPNPATNTVSMNYKMTNTPASAKLVVFNMLGAQVMETEITSNEGTVRMDVSILEQGVYFCSLVADNKTLTTRRLVVSH